MRRQLLSGDAQKDRILDIVRGIVGSFIDSRCTRRFAAAYMGLGRPQTDDV